MSNTIKPCTQTSVPPAPPGNEGQKENKMQMQVQKVVAAIEQIEAAMASGKLTEKMAHNAMVNLDRATPCFGRSAAEWKKTIGFASGFPVIPDYTKADLQEFLENKKSMFAQHSYVLDRP